MLTKRLKWVLSACLAVGLCALVWYGQTEPNERSDSADSGSPRFETKQKQTLVNRDMMLTDQLCRRQCKSDLRQTAAGLDGLSRADAFRRLKALGQEHPHMVSLIWSGGNGVYAQFDHSTTQEDHAGQPGQPIHPQLDANLRKAQEALALGESFESPQLQIDGEHYFVVAVPNPNGGGLTGVVRQSILNRVMRHQEKNLRLVPYPPEGNYKIESVDSDTHRDIHVDSGEENGGASHYHKQQVVVKFKTPPSTQQMNEIRRALQVVSARSLDRTYVMESKQQTAEQMLDYFRARDDVEYAEPHYLYMTNETAPNDYLFEPYQWNLPAVQTLEGWRISKGSAEIVIGVLDTGVDLDHPDLSGRLAGGINIIDPDAAPTDDVGHGTHVAGVISATVNNTEGIAGMTWFDQVMPIKVLDDSGAGSTYSVAEGIIWATDHGAKVINMSLGNYAEAQFLHDAIRYAFDRDVVLVAATGNDNTDEPGYPAAYPEVFAVSATDERLERAPFSNYGDYVDVVAPGVGIASTYPHNQYAALSGTSMASPHVTALAALIRSVNPLLRNTEVMDIMRGTATDLGPTGKDAQYGYGQIDVVAALAEAERMKHSMSLFTEWIKRDIERIRANGAGE